VVVVIHDSAAELQRLLDSVARHLAVRPQVVVVDNASADGGGELARAWGADVVAMPANAGFGAANNAGLALVAAPVTALVNPDVELLDDGLARLAQVAAARGALVAPRLLNRDGSVQRSAHPRPGTIESLLPALLPPALMPPALRLRADPWRATAPRRVGWAIGACLVAPTATLRRLGPFDPDLFLFYEDLDLCLRAASAGIATELHPEVSLRHAGAHSTTRAYGGEPHEQIARRRREVVERDLGRPALRIDDTAQAITFATRALAGRALGRDARREAAQLRALLAARR
jgi:GT2 family glycosyltransferase